MPRLLPTLVLASLSFATSLGAMAADSDVSLLTITDKRIPIKVTNQERNQVLYEMRALLQGMHNIHHALADNDMKALALAAKPMGPVLNRMPKSLRERLPEEFQEMGIAMHELFDVIARDATEQKNTQHSLEQLAEAMSYCAGCHDTYRFQVGRVTSKK